MDSIEAKISGMISLGLGTLFVGLLPAWFSSHSRQWPLLLSSLLCFGGGVLFSTSMVHILPELREISSNAELLFCAGFFILYLVDEFVHFCSSKEHHHPPQHDIDNNLSHSRGGHYRSVSLSQGNYGSIETSNLIAKSESNIYSRQKGYNPALYKARSHNDVSLEESLPSQICHINHTEPCHDPPIGHMGLLLALCIHAVLEGLAIGLEDSTSKVWLLVGAVASHKLVVGFCLGVELSSGVSSTVCRHFVAITVFSLGSVVGIGVGMTVTTLSSDWLNTIQPILQGIAGGTLLYVTVCEVLPRERARWHNQTTCKSASLVQFFAVAVGFVTTTLITKYLEFDHIQP